LTPQRNNSNIGFEMKITHELWQNFKNLNGLVDDKIWHLDWHQLRLPKSLSNISTSIQSTKHIPNCWSLWTKRGWNQVTIQKTTNQNPTPYDSTPPCNCQRGRKKAKNYNAKSTLGYSMPLLACLPPIKVQPMLKLTILWLVGSALLCKPPNCC
jgi:hypothetical protein